MSINACTFATKQCNNSKKYLLPGNIIPNEWYKIFCDEDGDPDLVAITNLADVVAWHCNGTHNQFNGSSPKFDGNSLCVSYDYFENKFGFSKDRVRRSFVRLEERGILKRTVQNIELAPGTRINRVSITLDSKFFNSCFSDPQVDIGVGSNPPTYDSQTNQSHDQCNHHTISNKNKKDRSTESSFDEISLVQNSKQPYEIPKVVKKNFWALPKQLKDFYPLSQEDATTLQSSCGREFSLNAMNEILKNMSERLSDRLFKSKRAFLSYMSKAFQYEMRDAVKISNENFKIRANQTNEEIETKRQEEYLAEIEYSLQVSPEWHFKKKIAAILDRTKAYDFLKNYRSSAVEESVCKIYLDKYVKLSKMDRAVILQQVKATHERFDLSTTEFQTIETIEIIMPEKKSIAEQIEQTNNHFDDKQLQITPALTGIWGNVRKILMSYYGEKGAALDRSWFSKLTAIEDAAGKSLTLTSPTRFICCYIQEHYQYLIKQFCKEKGYRLEIC